MMPFIQIIAVLIVVGLLLWAVGEIPMDGTIKRILRVLVIVAVVLWLMSAFGILPNLKQL
jgi:type IV secretory pathway TrbL component